MYMYIGLGWNTRRVSSVLYSTRSYTTTYKTK